MIKLRVSLESSPPGDPLDVAISLPFVELREMVEAKRLCEYIFAP